MKEVVANFNYEDTKFKGWLKDEYSQSARNGASDIFTGFLQGAIWLKKEPNDAMKWLFKSSKIEANFNVLEYKKSEKGVMVTIETFKETTEAIIKRGNVLKAPMCKVTLIKKT